MDIALAGELTSRGRPRWLQCVIHPKETCHLVIRAEANSWKTLSFDAVFTLTRFPLISPQE